MLFEPYVCIKCGRRTNEAPANHRCSKCGGEVVGEYSVHKAAQFLFSTEDLESLPADVEKAYKNPNNIFGRYVLIRLVGRGGAAEVFRAWHTGLKKYVAVKRIYGQNPDAILRLQREARNAARLNHPNIVQTHDMGFVEIAGAKWYYIAMDYIDGHPLGRAELTLSQKVRIVRDIADALQYAHEHHIIHRDVKPGNILVDQRGHTFLTDFGLARQINDPRLTVTDLIVGTPIYMSPEQAQGRNQAIDARSDIYSLGAALYEVLSGVSPFQGESSYEIINNVVNLPPLPLRSIDDRIDPDLDAVVLRAMEKDPAKRFQTAREFSAELTRYLEGSSRSPAMMLYTAVRNLRRHAVTLGLLVGLAVLAGSATFLLWSAFSKRPAPAGPTPGPTAADEDGAARRELTWRAAAQIDRFDRLMFGPAQERSAGLRLLEEAERTLTGLPADAETMYQLGRIRHRQGRLDQALTDLSRAISHAPHGRIYAARAWVQADLTLHTLLSDSGASAVYLRKKSADAGRADILRARDRGDAGEAEVGYFDALLSVIEDRHSEALGLLQRAIDLAQADLELSMRARSLMGDSLLRVGRALGAMREYEVVSTTRSNDLVALARFMRAAEAHLDGLPAAERPEGDLRAAREAAYRAGQIDASAIETEYLRGSLFILVGESELESGRRPEADLHSGLGALARVLEQDRSNGDAHYRASQGYFLLSRSAAANSNDPREQARQALHHCKLAAQLDGRNSRARILHAEITSFLSRFER